MASYLVVVRAVRGWARPEVVERSLLAQECRQALARLRRRRQERATLPAAVQRGRRVDALQLRSASNSIVHSVIPSSVHSICSTVHSIHPFHSIPSISFHYFSGSAPSFVHSFHLFFPPPPPQTSAGQTGGRQRGALGLLCGADLRLTPANIKRHRRMNPLAGAASINRAVGERRPAAWRPWVIAAISLGRLQALQAHSGSGAGYLSPRRCSS